MKSYSKIIAALVAGGIITSCAEQDIVEFVEPVMPESIADYAYINEYQNLKDYLPECVNPNLKLSVAVDPEEYNLRGVAFRAANYNFNEIDPTAAMYYGNVVSEDGSFDLSAVGDMLDYGTAQGVTFYGGALSSNNRVNATYLNSVIADWQVTITPDMREEVARVDFADYVDKGFPFDYIKTFKPTIHPDGYVTASPKAPMMKFYLLQHLPTTIGQEYEVIMFARSDKQATIPFKYMDRNDCSINKVVGTEWMQVTFKFTAIAEESTVIVDFGPQKGITLDVMWVSIGVYPPDHKEQTPEEKKENLTNEIVRYTDAMMKTCNGRVTSWNLLTNVLSAQNEADGLYSLKSSAESEFCWQDYLGSEDYAPIVAKAARDAYKAYEGQGDLTFFVHEDGLNDATDNYKKLRSVAHWIDVWNGKGANIAGISTTVHLTYTEDDDILNAQAEDLTGMLKALAQTGKQVRLSFDIDYVDIFGSSMATPDMSLKQKQNVSNLYRYVVAMYLKLIPADKQYSISLGSQADNGGVIGLWNASWDRNPAYAGWCEALKGKTATTETYTEYLKAEGLNSYTAVD